MKFSCTHENINRGLQVVSHIASRNVNLPILHNILIEAKDSIIHFVSTNLEIGIRMRIRGKVEEDGAFTIPAQVFSNYIGLVSSERVDISQQEELNILIQAGNQRTKIRGESANEFPLIPEVEKKNGIRVPAQELKEALKQTSIAASHDESRTELTGVLCEVKEKELLFVATDSYRLAERKISIQQDNSTPISIIIPASTITELIRILPDTEQEVELYVSDSQILFVTGDFEMTSRLIEGSFPDYEQIIPTQSSTTITVDREAMIKAIKAASLFSKAGIHDINLHFSPEAQAVTLTTVNNQIGENVTKLEAKIEGESNNTVFNYRYLLEGLSNIRTAKVSISLVDNSNPGMFRPYTDASETIDTSYLYIIMPIKQ